MPGVWTCSGRRLWALRDGGENGAGRPNKLEHDIHDGPCVSTGHETRADMRKHITDDPSPARFIVHQSIE